MVNNNVPSSTTLLSTDKFCYWLQGFFELNPDLTYISDQQIKIIREHLNMVFQHVYVIPTSSKLETLTGSVTLSGSATDPSQFTTIC